MRGERMGAGPGVAWSLASPRRQEIARPRARAKENRKSIRLAVEQGRNSGARVARMVTLLGGWGPSPLDFSK